MTTAPNERDGLLAQILRTPQGQEVAFTFLSTLHETRKIERAFDRAHEMAQNNGILEIIEFSALVDFLNWLVKYGPLIVQLIRYWLSKMDKK